MKKRNLKERFWEKVERTEGCWIWKGYRYPKGHGEFSLNNKSVCAHRVSWVLTFGEIPEGLWVLHRCDNRPCVRPDHLFLGTKYDNVRDCVSKNRQAKGTSHGMAKLTPETVIQIRSSFPSKSIAQLAKEFNVTKGNIQFVIDRKTWAHL